MMLSGPCNELDRSRLVRCGPSGSAHAGTGPFRQKKANQGACICWIGFARVALARAFQFQAFRLSAERDDWLHQLQPIDATRTESVGAERILSFG